MTRTGAAIVTGGAMGIGRASARRLGGDGWPVAIVDIDEGGAEVAAEIVAGGGAATFVKVDLADADAVAEAVATARERLGPVRVLFHSAIAFEPGSVQEVSAAGWDLTMNVGIRAAWLLTRAVLPDMVDSGGGSLVYASSVQAERAIPGAAAYDTVKAAVIGLTRQVAVEYGPHNVRANAVLPGAIDTRLFPRELSESFPRTVPLRRIGRPEEVAAVVAFLASDDASYVCGACLVVDGGFTVAAW